MGPIQPLFLRDLGATPQDIGLVFGAGNLFAAACFLPVGYLADRVGRKPVLVATFVWSTAGAAAFLPLQDWHGAFVGSALYWSGSAALPLMSAQLAATLPRALLGRALGLIFGAFFFGNIVASPLSGVIASAIGLRGAIACAVVAFMFSSALVFALRASPPTREHLRFHLTRTYWTLLFITPFAALLTSVSLVLLPVYLKDIAAVPLERIGVYTALVAIGAAVMATANGRLADAVGPVPALIAGATILTAGAALMALAGRNESLVGASAVMLGATQAANPVLAAAVERILPPTRIALGYASYQLAFAIGFGSGGAVAGLLYEADPLLPLLITVALALPVAATVGAVISRATSPQPASPIA